MLCFVVDAAIRRMRVLGALWVWLLCLPVMAAESDTLAQPSLLTNLFQLRQNAEQKPLVLHPFRIEGVVVDVDIAKGVLALRDTTGVEFIQLSLEGRAIEPGAMLCLEGNGYGVMLKGFGLALVPGMVIDNDQVHGMTRESGAVFLRAGLNPIRLQWFNREERFGLSAAYEGPNLPRQQIPGSALSRMRVDGNATNYVAGLDYRCYEGTWGYLPDFAKLRPAKTGIATNFDTGVRTRDEGVGVEFSGFIHIPSDGLYRFYLMSDDGSRLFAGESALDVRVLSRGSAPQALGTVPTGPERKSRPWITLEGTVEFAGMRGTGGELLLRAGNNKICVEIFEDKEVTPNLLRDTKVRIYGVYQEVLLEDGSPGPGKLLAASWKSVHPLSQLDTNTTRVTNDSMANQFIGAISTVAKIKAIPTEMARQQIPVSVRGVITAVLPSYLTCAVIQDSTKGIAIFLQDLTESQTLQVGELYQVDGVTGPGLYAPVINARKLTHMGTGQLPQPLRATWDQMMNGSLDTQYAEIEGVVTAVHNQQVVVLTEGGRITLDLSDFQPEQLAGCQDALVRIRGCLFASFNARTHELVAGSLRVMGAALEIHEMAPRDAFDASQKSIGQLLLYDPKAAPFRRVKVSGQVIYGRGTEYFLTDGTNGMRVVSRNADHFSAGDIVDTVGFLELAGPGAEIHEAMLRKTGTAALQAPTKLSTNLLLAPRYSGKLVQVQATLMDQWREGSEFVLDLQSGFLAFRARVDSGGQAFRTIPSGSRLELTGVYATEGNRAAGGTVSGFQLLLNSPRDIRILAMPSWWTLKRVLILAGILAVLLLVALAWNKVLQRKVEQRSRQLEAEIHNRQRAEVRSAAEAERSRIARDLHDELGAGLTAVNMLASTAVGQVREPEQKDERFRAIADKARALVSGLDVIVWAIDPKRNSLQSFADYIGRYASELFSASGIVCRFKIPIECDAVNLTEKARHSLFLAVKEALNNVIRHAAATEVELRISPSSERLEVVITDNGRGFDRGTIRRGNGLDNLTARLEALNGQCRIESQIGKGTTVEFIVPLPLAPNT
jgi:signal transduction histidine kinase